MEVGWLKCGGLGGLVDRGGTGLTVLRGEASEGGPARRLVGVWDAAARAWEGSVHQAGGAA